MKFDPKKNDEIDLAASVFVQDLSINQAQIIVKSQITDNYEIGVVTEGVQGEVLTEIYVKAKNEENAQNFIQSINTKIYPSRSCPKWVEQDLIDLILVNQKTNIPFSISEQKSPKVMKIAKEFGLVYTEIIEKKNLDNHATEVLLTNYEIPKYVQTEMFECNSYVS